MIPPIIFDTREQRPWPIPGAIRKGLKTGDYSVEGYEDSICLERKSLNDLVGSMTKGRARFLREVRRMRDYRFKCIVVEATVREVMEGQYFSRTNPNSILGSVVSLCIRHNVQVHFAGDRQMAQVFSERWLKKAAQYSEESTNEAD